MWSRRIQGSCQIGAFLTEDEHPQTRVSGFCYCRCNVRIPNAVSDDHQPRVGPRHIVLDLLVVAGPVGRLSGVRIAASCVKLARNSGGSS